MYFAQMYCYGWSYNCAGITGIRQCMGVIYKGVRALYAVHIPDHGKETNALGGKVFAEYVLGAEGHNMKNGELFLFANGRSRDSAEDEARGIRKRLKGPVTKVYRIMKNLGKGSGGILADSVTILVRHVHGGLEMKYKHVPDDNWVEGGNKKIGMYLQRDAFDENIVPSDQELAGGWYDVDDANCTCATIK